MPARHQTFLIRGCPSPGIAQWIHGEIHATLMYYVCMAQPKQSRNGCLEPWPLDGFQPEGFFSNSLWASSAGPDVPWPSPSNALSNIPAWMRVIHSTTPDGKCCCQY